MFAVKSSYSFQTPDGKDIPFYVADDNLYFKRADLANVIYGSLFGDCIFSNFENYDGNFVSFIDCRNLFLEQPQRFINRDFWRNIVNQDYSEVVAEVRDAQHFVKELFRLNLPEDWSRLDVDWVICHLDKHEKWLIEKCYKSLQILATNDEQRKLASRVYDEAWKILKAREKADNTREKADNKYTALHEVLAKFGLTDKVLIHAVLGVHETKFAKEQAKRQSEFNKSHAELESELRRILK